MEPELYFFEQWLRSRRDEIRAACSEEPTGAVPVTYAWISTAVTVFLTLLALDVIKWWLKR